MEETLNNDYELLEHYSTEDESQVLQYLRHKKTGLEIAYYQLETKKPGFSFCFKTPVEDPFLGTTHVLEHCVMTGSQKYDLDFIYDLVKYSYYSNYNACTTEDRTRYFFYSPIEDECFKLIPIIADYVFFPKLSEEAFMQECMHVDFDPEGDGRKKEIVGVAYNEMKLINQDYPFHGGLYYKLYELTNDKIKEYHKKYYRPDNCLFIFNGKASLNKVLALVDKFIPELELKFDSSKITPRQNLTIEEFLEKVPFKELPNNENPNLNHWSTTFSSTDICGKIEEYWAMGFSPFMSYCLDEKYAYSAYCWYIKNNPEQEFKIPEKKAIPKIISEYLAKFTSQEYKTKLEKLHKWQERDVRDMARKIMEPLAINNIDIELPEATEIKLNYCFDLVETEITKDSCTIYFTHSKQPKNFYAECALIVFLELFLRKKLCQLGKTYNVIAWDFTISTLATNKPERTLQLIKKLIKETENYTFTEADLLAVKTCLLGHGSRYCLDFSKETLNVTAEDLHQAAVRFSHMIEPPKHKHDRSYYYTLGEPIITVVVKEKRKKTRKPKYKRKR